ncbi:MAG TPA: methyltransferase domain-containing protein [Nitrospirota bacterium]|nr:methyltransferase domain-containing protein [Nitrospirota bacterium]
MKQLISDHVPQVLKDILGQVNKVLYRGAKYKCPLCLNNLRSFLPLPSEFRIALEIQGRRFTASDFETLNVDEYLCPVCRCADRDRLSALFLKRLPKEPQSKKTLLHFAPERALSFYLRRNFRYSYRTADLFRKDVDDRVDISRMDNYATSSIDCFICSHVLEHVQDDASAVKELFRILKPTGWGILLAPIIPDLARTYEDPSKTTEMERLQYFGQKDHLRVYGKTDFINLLKAAGFKVSQLGAKFFGENELERHGIAKRSCLYVVHKTPELAFAEVSS